MNMGNNWLNISRIALISGTIVYILAQLVFGEGFDKPIQELLKSFAIYQLYAFVLTFSNGLFFDYFRRKYPESVYLKKAMILKFFGSLIISGIALVLLRFVVIVGFYGGEPSSFLNNSKGYFWFGLTITTIVTLMFYVFYYFKISNEKKVTQYQVVAKTETAKYESLKSQLDPHFLFNSLNVLTSLISENPDLAEKFTTKLSRVYRYVLEQKSKDLIPLKEELDFAQSYMELLKVRFEDAIQFKLPHTISNEDFKIVPLSLQILLENAVKHNVISNENPLIITIEEDEGALVVTNNLKEKSNLGHSTKVGLKNIKERYSLITKRAVEIENDQGEFKVKIPLLTQKVKIMKIDSTREAKYLKAREQVDEIIGFYSSLIAYCLVIPFLIFIWYKFTPHTIQWFWFPMFGWGIGLVFQWLKAFNYNPIFGKNWEQKKIKELMNEDDKYWQ